MDRIQKHGLVQSLKTILPKASLVVVTRQFGLSVSEVSGLRQSMRKADVSFRVLKNTLAKIAVTDTELECLIPLFKGPMALAYSNDPVAAAKVSIDFANANEKLEVVGGALNGKFLSAQDVKNLSQLPSLEQLQGQLLGVIMQPGSLLARVVNEPGSSIARVLKAYTEK